MSDQETLFPLEFFIEETPKSLRASPRSREQWKQTVGDAARLRVQETVDMAFLDGRPLALTIFYFPAAEMEGDVDNIVKLISDGMINIAYPDDRVIERVLAQKFELGVERTFVDVTQKLAAALDADAPVVYIRVDDVRWRTL